MANPSTGTRSLENQYYKRSKPQTYRDGTGRAPMPRVRGDVAKPMLSPSAGLAAAPANAAPPRPTGLPNALNPVDAAPPRPSGMASLAAMPADAAPPMPDGKPVSPYPTAIPPSLTMRAPSLGQVPQSMLMTAGQAPAPVSLARPATPVAAPVAPAPMTASTMSQRLRSGYYNPQGAPAQPAAADVLAARQRLAAEQAGGASLAQARALSEGRRDAASRIANASGKAMVPSYPSPLDGTAQQFRSLAEREAAQRAASDAKAVEQYQRYQAARDADTNNNGIPDRDEAVASKFGTVGINNINDLQTASAQYRNYLGRYRQSGLQGQTRAMTFDEFAKNMQEQRKSLPVFGLDTPPQAASATAAPAATAAAPAPQAAAPQAAMTPTQQRVDARRGALQNMRERQDMAAQNAMFMSLTPQERANIVTQQTNAATSLAEIQSREQQANNALTLARLQQEERMAQADLQFKLQMAKTDEDRQKAREEFEIRKGQIDAANEIAKAELGLKETEAKRDSQMQGLELATSVVDPAIAADEEYGRAYSELMLQFPNEPERVRAAAEQRAQLAYNQALRQYSAVSQSGLVPDLQPASPFPSEFTFQPPTIASVDLAGGVPAPATPDIVVKTIAAFEQARKRRPTREELLTELKENGYIYTREEADALADAALGERGKRSTGFSMWSDTRGAGDAYSILQPESASKLSPYSWDYPHYDSSGNYIGPYSQAQAEQAVPVQQPAQSLSQPRGDRRQYRTRYMQ